MKYKVRINPIAIADLQEIKDYISGDNPEAAVRMINNIYSRLEKLADFPEIGANLSAKIKIETDYRFIICKTYLIFYKVEGEFVSIYRILNGIRDYLSILITDEPSN